MGDSDLMSEIINECLVMGELLWWFLCCEGVIL